MAMEGGDLTWDEVHQTLRPLMRTDNRTNIRYIVQEYTLLATVLFGCATLHEIWVSGLIPTWAFIPLAVLGIALVGACQHRFSGLAHDATHYTLFRNRLANELASDLLLMFPILAFTQKYRLAHLGHHQHVNDPERDPDWLRLEQYEPMRFPMRKPRFLLRYVFRGLWPPAILRYLFGRARAANLGGGRGVERATFRNVYRFRVARCLRGTYWLGLLIAIHTSGAWQIFWLFWVVPLLTAYPFLMLLREIAHHANAPDRGRLTNSRVFQVHPLLAFAVFPYGQAFHLTHHLFAMVPHYRIEEADRLLRRCPPYREQVVVCRGYFLRPRGSEGPSVLDVLSNPAPRATAIAPPPRLDQAQSRTLPGHHNHREIPRGAEDHLSACHASSACPTR